MLSYRAGICIYVIWLQSLSILPQGLCKCSSFPTRFFYSPSSPCEHLYFSQISAQSSRPWEAFHEIVPISLSPFHGATALSVIKVLFTVTLHICFQCSLRVACRMPSVCFACPVPKECLARGNHSIFVEWGWERIRWDFEMHWDLGVWQLSTHSPWNIVKYITLKLFLKLWGKNISIACFVFQVISVVLKGRLW